MDLDPEMDRTFPGAAWLDAEAELVHSGNLLAIKLLNQRPHTETGQSLLNLLLPMKKLRRAKKEMGWNNVGRRCMYHGMFIARFSPSPGTAVNFAVLDA